jgi:putative sterol carrier protein
MAKAEPATTPSARFLEALGSGGYEPLLGDASGTVRIDLVDRGRTQRWFLTLEEGIVSVSRRNASADCVVRADRKVFDALVRGETNAMAAYLRGDLEAEGDPELLVVLQRVFRAPRAGSPPSAKGRNRGRRR